MERQIKSLVKIHSRRDIIVYLALGDRHANQAIFSIITLINLYGKRPLPFKIIIFTDNPSAFEWLSQNFMIQAIHLSHNQINEWLGAVDYMPRLKIRALQEVLNSEDTNVLFVDTDTLFLKKVDILFEKIFRGFSIMHLFEWPLASGRKLNPELCPKDVIFNLKSGLSLSVDGETPIWNSGVIGISSENRKNIHDILELNDALHAMFPSCWHVEQLAVSAILSKTSNLIGNNGTILHYWHNKGVLDKYTQHLPFVKAEQIETVLKKAIWDKRIIAFVILFKFYSFKLKVFIRDLPYAYQLYLLIKPMLKWFKK